MVTGSLQAFFRHTAMPNYFLHCRAKRKKAGHVRCSQCYSQWKGGQRLACSIQAEGVESLVDVWAALYMYKLAQQGKASRGS